VKSDDLGPDGREAKFV